MADPPDVLELQVRGVVEVDVALRGAVDQQRPGRAARSGSADQLGPSVVHLGADDRARRADLLVRRPPWNPAPTDAHAQCPSNA